MPGIVMVGTFPIFFKIPVTQALLTHIGNGTYPPEETHVTYCYPPVPRHPLKGRYEGMKPLDNRHVILRCYEAFKLIVAFCRYMTWRFPTEFVLWFGHLESLGTMYLMPNFSTLHDPSPNL